MLPMVKERFECFTLTQTRPTPVKTSQFELLIIQRCVAVHEQAIGSEKAEWFYCGCVDSDLPTDHSHSHNFKVTVKGKYIQWDF